MNQKTNSFSYVQFLEQTIDDLKNELKLANSLNKTLSNELVIEQKMQEALWEQVLVDRRMHSIHVAKLKQENQELIDEIKSMSQISASMNEVYGKEIDKLLKTLETEESIKVIMVNSRNDQIKELKNEINLLELDLFDLECANSQIVEMGISNIGAISSDSLKQENSINFDSGISSNYSRILIN